MYHNLCYMTEADRTKLTREEKHHVYVKWQTRICTTWPSFLFTFRLLFIIFTSKLVVSCNFLSIRIIVLSCFYLLIFYFEEFSTWIWRMPFAVYFSNSSIIHKENTKLTTQCFITRWNTSNFVKNTPLCIVFSTLFSPFHLVMKHYVSCLIYYVKLKPSFFVHEW